MGPKIVTGLGCAGFALSFLVLLVSVALPAVTDGRTSWSEAMAGIVPGAVCSALSLVVLVAGGVWLMAARKRARG